MARRQYKIPFAATGDKASIPDAAQGDGSVSLATGYGFDYQRDLSGDPQAKPIPREAHNGILNEITASIGEIQQTGYPIWVVEGKPYPIKATVRHNDDVWVSNIANNNSVPGVADWRRLDAIPAVAVSSTPSGNISATNVQAAINELDNEKAAISGQVFTGEITYRGGGGVASNTSYGEAALQSNTTGTNNTASGLQALMSNTTGNNNTALGYSSGRGIITGHGNSILGANVTGLAANLTNNIILASGDGAIKMRYDGSAWQMYGTVNGITKVMVGLGNVDNTPDGAKPVSALQQAALNLKANLSPPGLTGTATFTKTSNNINLNGIGSIGLEIGDVITIKNSALNNSEFTVEVITNANNIIVNAAHANGTTSKSLKDEAKAGVTAGLLAKWYNAPVGLGQAWQAVAGSRAFGTAYTNSTGRPIYVYVTQGALTGPTTLRTHVDGLLLAEAISSSANRNVSSVIVPPRSVYSFTAPTGGSLFLWHELR